MQNKEQERVLSVQASAGLSAVSIIATNLFAKWDARVHAQRAYFTIQGDKNASPRRTDAVLVGPSSKSLASTTTRSCPTLNGSRMTSTAATPSASNMRLTNLN